MAHLIFLFVILINNIFFIECQNQITNIKPSPINFGDYITIYGSGFDKEDFVLSFSNERGKYLFQGVDMVDSNTILINQENWNIEQFCGDGQISYSPVLGESSFYPVTFAYPFVQFLHYNAISGLITINGTFTTKYPIYLRNYTFVDPLEPSSASSEQLIFKDYPRIVSGSASLQIDKTEYILPKRVYTNYLATDLVFIPIKRESDIVVVEGKYLTYDKHGVPQYSIGIVKDDELPKVYSCRNIVSTFLGNQSYRVTCEKDIYGKSIRWLFNHLFNGFSMSTVIPYIPPTIISVSSTFFNEPAVVTISGFSLCPSPNITIGNSSCQVTSSDDWKKGKLYCMFQSDVALVDNQPLTVNVSCDDNSIANIITFGTADIFLYSQDECYIGVNNLVCSGNGTCTSNKKCQCNNGYSGSDCSIVSTVPPPPPIIDNTTAIIETTESKFQIGIVQIREMDIYNKVFKSYNLTDKYQRWELVSNENRYQYVYGTTLKNGAEINVQMSINNNSESSQQHDFLGDIITILPNSIKYQIEITKWKSNSSLNQIQLIFQTDISSSVNQDCGENLINSEKKVQMLGDTIRSVELTLVNGQTLVGTFSSRMHVDGRVVQSQTKILSDEDSIGIPSVSKKNKEHNQASFTSVTFNSFNEKVIIDPNFGVLLKDYQISKCNKFANWKIAVIIVCGVVGLALIILVSLLVYSRFKNNSKIISIRLKMKNFTK
ncbi:hypothetical protein DICPUDRAFT_79092 [Dictyostelium purpureum]|uniref:EGF-like domain-containing protein n=1 Tax=Dictyostelium purpureum TaxID=5786 RepID=F0ZLJ2_DICPU|nr:uncharacterized protein DICPUDRAFT_79092 [Dictyostelium purpureum]EGC35187.1 hypothetical protein DICPUDRAFT_79092 [Dictyostelium purpureum]|eukprot:XP_003288275.1 hypothetical protein DICPUDRAFT_79092 [Dictyostelium purpureum]